jgi:predicted nucleic acid-binding protein
MSDVVTDSCVMVKWVQPEPDSAAALQLVTDTGAAGGRVISLDFAIAEVANALWKRFHQKKLTAAEVSKQFGVLSRMPLVTRPGLPLVPNALDLATRYDLPAYDCLFVALTLDLGIRGVTSDEPLWRAVHADHPHIHLLRNWPPPP